MRPVRVTVFVLAGLWALGIGTSALGGFMQALAVVTAALLLGDVFANR